jgi:hypothetical protein
MSNEQKINFFHSLHQPSCPKNKNFNFPLTNVIYPSCQMNKKTIFSPYMDSLCQMNKINFFHSLHQPLCPMNKNLKFTLTPSTNIIYPSYQMNKKSFYFYFTLTIIQYTSCPPYKNFQQHLRA